MQANQIPTPPPQDLRRSPLFRWALALQFFGMALFALALGLAFFTDTLDSVGGIVSVGLISLVGALVAIPARVVLMVQMTAAKKNAPPPSQG